MRRAIVVLTVAAELALTAAPCYASSVYSDAVLADNPVGYWRLDETSGTTAVNLGSAGAASNGIYTGAVVQGVTGAIPNDSDPGAAFSGGAVNIAGTSNFPKTNDFTIEAWVSATTVGGYREFFSTHGYVVGANNGFLEFTTLGIQEYDLTPALFTANSPYHHIVVAFDASNDAHFYVDGAFAQTVVGASPASTIGATMSIGRRVDGVEQWNGRIDEVAYYSYVLSAAQVAAHYDAAFVPVPEPSSFGLLAVAVLGALRHRRRS